MGIQGLGTQQLLDGLVEATQCGGAEQELDNSDAYGTRAGQQ